eukprot:Pgem_evm1s1740
MFHALQSSHPIAVLTPIINHPYLYFQDLDRYFDAIRQEPNITRFFREDCHSVQMAFSLCTLYGNHTDLAEAFQNLFPLLDNFLGQVPFATDLRLLEQNMFPIDVSDDD